MPLGDLLANMSQGTFTENEGGGGPPIVLNAPIAVSTVASVTATATAQSITLTSTDPSASATAIIGTATAIAQDNSSTATES